MCELFRQIRRKRGKRGKNPAKSQDKLSHFFKKADTMIYELYRLRQNIVISTLYSSSESHFQKKQMPQFNIVLPTMYPCNQNPVLLFTVPRHWQYILRGNYDDK